MHARAEAAWRAKSESHERARPRIRRVALPFVLLASVARSAWLAVTGAGMGECVGAGLLWLVFGAGVVRVLTTALGPGRPPVLLPSVPQNISFDPPPDSRPR